MMGFLENLVRRGMGISPAEIVLASPAPVEAEAGGAPEWGEEAVEAPAVPRPVGEVERGTIRVERPIPQPERTAVREEPPAARAEPLAREPQPRRQPAPRPAPVTGQSTAPAEPDRRPTAGLPIARAELEPERPATPPPAGIPEPRPVPQRVVEREVMRREPAEESQPATQQPPLVIEKTTIQPLVRVEAGPPGSVERIETRLDRQERETERIIERVVERDAAPQFRSDLPTCPEAARAADRPPASPEKPAAAPAGRVGEERARPEPERGQLPAAPSAKLPLLRPAPVIQPPTPPRPAAALPRRQAGAQPKAEVRIGTIEIRANRPPAPPQPRAPEPKQAPEDFAGYRELRDFSGWYRG